MSLDIYTKSFKTVDVQFGNNAVRGCIIGKCGTESYVPFRKYMINSRNINILASSGSVMMMLIIQCKWE